MIKVNQTMREIKCRGKRVANGEWVYGYYIQGFTGIAYIFVLYDHILNMIDRYEVDPETVGQYTELEDKNGVEIFEGDIVREHVNDYTPIYQNGIYMAYNVDKINDPYVSTQFNVIWRNGCEVIGNIHDDPELLQEDTT